MGWKSGELRMSEATGDRRPENIGEIFRRLASTGEMWRRSDSGERDSRSGETGERGRLSRAKMLFGSARSLDGDRERRSSGDLLRTEEASSVLSMRKLSLVVSAPGEGD